MIDYKNSSNTDKPDMRERLLEYGPQNLSDSDLVAILLRTGIKDKPVKELADDIILHIDRARSEKIEGYLRSIRGKDFNGSCCHGIGKEVL